MTRDQLVEIGVAIAKKHGIRIDLIEPVQKRLEGRVSPGRIKAPWPTTTVKRLHIFAHEVGHIARGHVGSRRYVPRWRQEYEAEIFAFEAMRSHGVEVTDDVMEHARKNVHHHLKLASRNGADLTLVEDEVAAFARWDKAQAIRFAQWVAERKARDAARAASRGRKGA